MNEPRIALYSRVSTEAQVLDGQAHALEAWAAARGCQAPRRFADVASGARDSRPALDRLLEAARRREIDIVAVTKLDRLGRSLRHLTGLAAELHALGVDLVALEQGIDTTTATGKLLFNILGSIAEFERELIRDRTCAGLVAARARGARLGRPPARVPDAALAEALAGAPVATVARQHGVPRTTLLRRLARARRQAQSA